MLWLLLGQCVSFVALGVLAGGVRGFVELGGWWRLVEAVM